MHIHTHTHSHTYSRTKQLGEGSNRNRIICLPVIKVNGPVAISSVSYLCLEQKHLEVQENNLIYSYTLEFK